MKIITKRVQKEIRKDRNVVYDYIMTIPTPVERMEDFERAIDALVEISCDCGLRDEPWKNDGDGE